MQQGYITDRILDEGDLDLIKMYLDNAEWQEVFQDYNLFNLLRHDVPSEVLSRSTFYSKLQEYAEKMGGHKEGVGAYFLKYIPDSFTRMHQDHESRLTIVTMIDSEDLVGGDAIVRTRYRAPEKGRPAHMKCSRGKEENNPPYGHDIIMEVLPVEKGESLIYGNDLMHAVSKVHSGQRTVLITWFR